MNLVSVPILRLVVLAGALLAAGCAHSGAGRQSGGDSGQLENEIRRAVEAFQVNAAQLYDIYDRLHEAAAAESGRRMAVEQLGYIQKAYLYIHQARMTAACQIRLLSDYPLVKADRRADFLTLRAQDLDRAIADMEDAAAFLAVYAAFIRDSAIQADIEKGQQMIGGTVYLCEKLLAAIHPSVNPASPFSRDPYGPFSRDL